MWQFIPEAVFFKKKLFQKIWKKLQENTCIESFFSKFSGPGMQLTPIL